MTTALPLRVTRLLAKAEFHWLDADIPEGTTVYPYHGFTYGCVSHRGRAVTIEPNKEPFFEIPKDAVEALKKMQETMP